MSGVEALTALVLSPKIRKCVDQHRACIERAQDRATVHEWVNHTEKLNRRSGRGRRTERGHD